jgi:hypothetical protein
MGLPASPPLTVCAPRAANAGVVKMRRGEVAKCMVMLNSLPDLYSAFDHFLMILASKAAATKPQVSLSV